MWSAFGDKVARNTTLLYSEKQLHDYYKAARNATSHLRFVAW